MKSRPGGYLFGLAMWLLAFGAAAQPSSSRISLHCALPDECPDDVQIVHAVETLLGRSLPDAGERSLSVSVNVQGDPRTGYAARILFTSANGKDERYLEHPSCESLVHAVALVVALTIDPERVSAVQRERESARVAPTEPVPGPVASSVQRRPTQNSALQPAPPAPPRTAARGREPLRGARFALEGLAGAGPLPQFGVGMQAALGWHRQSFRAELVGRYWVPRQAAVQFDPSATLELGLVSVGARACYSRVQGVWQFSGCVGADIGDLSGQGQGVQNPHTRHARYSDLAAGVGVAYAQSRLAPEGGFELAGALERPPFGVRQNGLGISVFQPAAWAFTVFLGLSFEL